ncbi:class I SAM-dependent methyltransferase [Polluticoccus soli]|uniref:class I SAM-dependent methyltransferase n=1 Tax=Polluticoccus soli TaxID=3034150 RepID=UPI0023E34E15|nr:methyltransferase domain-containing protein [Flavipsychrobacter sp. JY13-12]
MERIRKPLQGVLNIVRFNWHLYAISGFIAIALLVCGCFAGSMVQFYATVLASLILGTTFVSLLVSCYIYDLSDLYKLSWLDFLKLSSGSQIVNVHAGFDETSALLCGKFSNTQITVLDFYDPKKHTEPSIKRARRAYAQFPGTQKVNTAALQLNDKYAEVAFIILSAHEIRNPEERVSFFAEVSRILKPGGIIVVTEHLRDTANFLVYNIGCFHFHSRKSWLTTFRLAGLGVERTIRITPFITTFILKNDGITS